MSEGRTFYVGSRGHYLDFKIKDISLAEDDNVDISLNHLYLSLHKDDARDLAEGILKALEPLTKKED